MRKLSTVIVFIFILAFSISCENEDILQLESAKNSSKQNSSVEIVNIDDIPNIVDRLNITAGKLPITPSLSKRGKSKFWIDDSHIISLKDSVDNTTYVFRIRSSKPSQKEFYNLVVPERTTGEEITPFVMKYKFKKGNRRSYAAQKENKKFEGYVDVIALSEFVNVTDLQSKDLVVTPCYDDIGVNLYTTVSDGTSGSSGGSGGSSSGSNSGSTGTSYNSGGVIVYSSTGGSSGYVEVGNGTFTQEVCESCQNQKNSNYSSKYDDCPEGVLLVPINDDDQLIDRLCYTYAFSKIGPNYVANITGIQLSFLAIGFDSGEMELNTVKIQNLCINVPAHWTSSKQIAREFKDAYNIALPELLVLMNVIGLDQGSSVLITDKWIKQTLSELIADNINAILFFDEFVNGTGTSFVTTSYCAGAPSTRARFNCD